MDFGRLERRALVRAMAHTFKNSISPLVLIRFPKTLFIYKYNLCPLSNFVLGKRELCRTARVTDSTCRSRASDASIIELYLSLLETMERSS